jgi:AmmeMemoRadiSam system protein B
MNHCNFISFAFCVFLSLNLAASTGYAAERIQKAIVSGTFYDDDSARLKKNILERLSKAKKRNKTTEKPQAILVPHAPYYLGGDTMAAAYSFVQGHSYRRVIILAQSVTKKNRGIDLPSTTHFETPVGKVEIDRNAVAWLAGAKAIGVKDVNFQKDYTIEVQLPFLQTALKGDFKIVPVLFRSIGVFDYSKIAKRLGRVWTKDTLVVISSNFFSFGPRFHFDPIDHLKESWRRAEYGYRVSKMFWETIQRFNAQAFNSKTLQVTRKLDGHHPIMTFLTLTSRLDKKWSAHVVSYENSSRLTKEWNNSVSYLGMVFFSTKINDAVDSKSWNQVAEYLEIEKKMKIKRDAKLKKKSKSKTSSKKSPSPAKSKPQKYVPDLKKEGAK